MSQQNTFLPSKSSRYPQSLFSLIPFFLLVGLFVFSGLLCPVQAQEAKKTFLWDHGDQGYGFWRKAINCGNGDQPGSAKNTQGSKINIGTTKEQRFPGSNSVEFWTNAKFEEECNQNFSTERAELASNEKFRSLGINEDSTLWLGWSEKWTDLDESHITTTLQFRSNCSSGSPATKINMLPNRRLVIKIRQMAGYPEKVVEITQVEEGVWYDMVVEVKYSKSNNGYIKVWMHQEGANKNLAYAKPTAQILDHPTMLPSDNCPHIRWGVYRHQSGDKKPSQIKPEDQMMVKYIGPLRIHTGNNLGELGFNLVKPRPLQ